MPNKKTSVIFFVLVIFVAAVWFFQRDNDQAASISATVVPIQKAGDRSTTLVKSNAKSSEDSAQLAKLSDDRNRIGLFDQPVRSLMRSNSIVKVDYGRLRAITQCLSFLFGPNAKQVLIQSLEANSKLSEGDLLVDGRSTLNTRQDALARSTLKCSKLFEGNTLSANENIAFNAQPEVGEWRAIMQLIRGSLFDLNSAQTKVAIEKVMSGPMYGALEVLLYDKLDFQALRLNYTPEQATAMQGFVVPVLLCQLGDDCLSGGIVADQLCWQSGICGETVETAILDHFRTRQIDTTAFQKFISSTRAAIVRHDISIFHK